MAERTHRRQSRPEGGRGASGIDLIFGLHAAEAALRNPQRRIERVHASENAAHRLAEALRAGGVAPGAITPAQLSARLGRDTVHQGVLVEARPLPGTELEEVLAQSGGPAPGPVIVLDQVTDPHNVGAILRSAAAFGAIALVTTRRNSPPTDGVLAKAACGGVEHVPVVKVTNLSRALAAIGDAGRYRAGLDGGADSVLESAPLDRPCAIVLGAEDRGLRRLTAENCDALFRIATEGPLASLNVSNAAAIALQAAFLARSRARAELEREATNSSG